MNKYFEGIKIQVLSAYQFRFNTVTNLFFWNLNIIAAFMFWMVIFQQNDIVGQYNRQEMLTFILLIKVTSMFAFHMICIQISQLIKEGGLSYHLLLPQNFFLQLYYKTFGSKIVDLFLALILFTLIMPVIGILQGVSIDFSKIGYFIIAIIIGSIISYLIGVIVGILAFFVQEVFSIIWIVLVVINFLSGQFIPLDLFPDRISTIVTLLPFSSFGFFPARILIGGLNTTDILRYFIVYLGWCGILLLFSHWLWKQGLKKYTSVGA